MSLRILVVDASLTLREMLRQTLTEAGFTVTLAEDGLDALDRLADAPPDLVLTELALPRLDGLGLLAAIRSGSVAPFVPIVVLTADCTATAQDRARAAGASGMIIKPFDEAALVESLRRFAAG
ncbi:MAG: response regulator [Rhodobacteraceae bacterium]|nr:response regulator [Paracoccaceae bacterium]